MERRVALTGVTLVVVGIVLQVLVSPPYPSALLDPGPLSWVVTFGLQVLPTVFIVAVIVGSLLLALAAVWRVTGTAATPESARGLLGRGVVLILVAAGGDYLMYNSPALYETMQAMPYRLYMGLSTVFTVVQVIGCALLAFWLTGRLGSAARIPGEPRATASRPF